MSAVVSSRSPNSGPVPHHHHVPVSSAGSSSQQPTLLGITHTNSSSAPSQSGASDFGKIHSDVQVLFPNITGAVALPPHALLSGHSGDLDAAKSPKMMIQMMSSQNHLASNDNSNSASNNVSLPPHNFPLPDANMLPMAQGEDWSNAPGGGDLFPSVKGATGKKKKEKGKRPVEVVVCQGTNTMLPKSRSSGERKYICNGHAIHRVTFWRHRKHGCPHSGQPGAEGMQGEGPMVSNGNERSSPSHLHESGIQHPQSQQLGSLSSPTKNSGNSAAHLQLKMKPLSMNGFAMMDVNVDLSNTATGNSVPGSKHNSNHFELPSIRYEGNNNQHHPFPLPEMAPGSVPGHLEHVSLAPQIPGGLAHAGFLGGHRSGSSHPPNQRFDMMPPFSMVSDSMNLYYAPYRASELDEEEISSPINANYANPSSPYGSQRSEASDFLEDNDMVFKSYLDRNE